MLSALVNNIASFKTSVDEHKTSKKTTTHDELTPSGLVCVAEASESVGETHCLSNQNNGVNRLAKQQDKYTSQTLTGDSATFGFEVQNNPHLCGNYTFRRYQWGEKEKFRPCFSASCANPYCRRKWSELWHNMLVESFKDKPPTHFITISFGDNMPKPKDCSSWLKSIHRKNRSAKPYEYLTQVELGERGNFHVHILARTTLDAEVIKQNIKRSIPTNTDVSVKVCDDDTDALARYIVKDKPGHAGVVIPHAYKGQGKRHPLPSKNFLSASEAELTKRAIQSFAAKNPQRGDVKATSNDTSENHDMSNENTDDES